MSKDVKVDFEGKIEEAIELEFKVNGKDAIDLDIEDGSILTLKPIIFKVLKLKDKLNPENQPIYLVNAHIFISTTNVPKEA